jgi:cardiolipin synthase
VRVLYDWFGSVSTSRGFWKHLRSAGVEVRAFHPPRVVDVVSNVSRNHRKLVVADGTRAVLGGLCIGCEWTGEGISDGQPWRDTAVDISGPAAAVLDQTFVDVWEVAGGEVPPEQVAGVVPPRGNAGVRVISGEPGRERAYRVIELLAAGSVERLWITDAYLVAPPRLFQALRDSARDGVDVRLLVPGSSDLPWIRNLSRIGYRDLLRSGVRIYEWDGPMLHAKTIVCDDRWVRIGSSNLNPSSLLGNYELDVLIEDPALAGAMQGQFRRDVARSREVASRPVRGPRRISQALPAVLTHQDPEVASSEHHRSGREMRRRAALVLRALASNARRSVFGPISAMFIALGLLFVALPRESAYVLAALCAWFALGAGREAFRRRADR